MNTNMSILRQILSMLTLVCVLLVPAISHAEVSSEVIGKVIVSSGTFRAVGLDGKQRILKRRSPIYEGDTLVTSEKGRAQVRLKDGAVIDIKSATELKLEEYSFNGEQDGTERSTMNLLKGGFRTITGAIGKKNKKNYKVTTRIATIGIRGTHYGIHDCNANCTRQTADGTEQVSDGLYGGVVDGKIVMQNDAGQSEFGNDQYFHLASAGEQPEYLMEPPAIVFEGSAEPEEQAEVTTEETSTASSDGATGGDTGTTGTVDSTQETDVAVTEGEAFPDDYALDTTEATEETPIETQLADAGTATSLQLDTTSGTTTEQALPPEPKSNTTNVYSFATAINGSLGLGSITSVVDPDKEYVTATDISGNDALASIYVDGTIDPQCNPCAFNVTDPSAGNLVESGNDTPLNVSWGRWSNNFTLSQNGTTETTQRYFHYIYTDKSNITPPTAFQTLAAQYATVSYSYKTGTGTSPTRYDGTNHTIGALDTSTGMTLDLTNQTITQFKVDVTVIPGPTENWSGSLAGAPIAISPVMGDIPLAVTVDGTSGGYGVASGTFVGSAAEGFAGSYGMADATNSRTVTGTMLLER